MAVSTTLKDILIRQVVTRLRKFGFVNVNKDNIATDEVYRQYFYKILNEKLGEDRELDLVITQLLESMDLNNEISRS